MKDKTKKWLNEKIVITLSRNEMFDLANVIADGTRNDYDFTKSRDRKVRKLFRESIEKRHNLWKKVINNAQRKRGVKISSKGKEREGKAKKFFERGKC